VHHPVYNKHKTIVATAITNLDIHDLAREACTYGMAGYYVVTPVTAQRELAEKIIGHWTGGVGMEHNDKRSEALSLVRTAADLDAAIDRISADHGGVRPYVVATAAAGVRRTLGFTELVDLMTGRSPGGPAPGRPLLVLFGTGWGLADEVFSKVDATLAPIRGVVPYNHLSVRAAAAIVCDRLLGLGPK